MRITDRLDPYHVSQLYGPAVCPWCGDYTARVFIRVDDDLVCLECYAEASA